MKYTFIGILLFGGFFFQNSVNAKVLSRDKMVFKVARSVFTLHDLKQAYTHINDLKCMYGESLLHIIFKDQFKKKNSQFFKLL